MRSLLSVLALSIHALLSWSQEISIQQNRVQVPILKYKSHAPVLQFKIHGSAVNPVTEISIEFEGTIDLQYIDSLFLFDLGKDSTWTADPIQRIGQESVESDHSIFSFLSPLPVDEKYFLLAVRIKDDTPLDYQLSTGIDYVKFQNSSTINLSPEPMRTKQRIGVRVRDGGDDGVARYRIPGLARTHQNALLAIYDVRRDLGRDLQGNIDIGVSRSTDGGNTWEPMRIALDMKKYGNLPEKFNGVSDACILVDENSESIFVAGCWMHGVIDSESGKPISNLTDDSSNWNHQWRHNGSLPGYDIDETSQFLITRSTDDGKTWEEPINITQQIKRPEWHLLAPAPGSGITLEDGTLVFPSQGKDVDQSPFSNITFSQDGGRTWQSSHPSYTNTTENMVVQLSDGSIMQNMRDNRNRDDKSDTNGRAVFTTKDLGESWIQHPSHHSALIEPVCMGSLYKHTYQDTEGQTKSILLFSNPNSKHRRERLTIKVSFDEGKTWPEKHWLLLDELALSGGYSSLTSIDNSTLGIIYEGSQAQMTFQQIALQDLGILEGEMQK